MLRQLPVHDPAQLIEFLQQYPGDPRLNMFSPEDFRYIRDHNDVFSGLFATSAGRLPVRIENHETESVDGETVTGSYFAVLGLKPAIGRLITQEDDRASPVAVLSWSYWKDKCNLDPAIVGKRITIGDVPATIVGVAPREFSGLRTWLRTQVWLSAARGGSVMGRLRPGVTLERAEAQVAVLYRQAQTLVRGPLWNAGRLDLEPAGAGMAIPVLRDRFAKPLVVLMAIVGVLLLLACANVAGLLLARGAAREHEMAVRVSLGAGRWRLMRQVLTEALLLSAAGTLFGIVLAWFGGRALLRVIASGRPIPGVPESLEIPMQPDINVLLFTGCVAVLTGLLFGAAPALRAMAATPASSLRAVAAGVETRRSRRFGMSLVVAQVALSVLLLSAGSLFILRLSQLRGNLGFQSGHLLLVQIDPAGSGYNRQRLAGLYKELLDRLEAIPGVRSSTLCGPTPISGAGASRFVAAEGHYEKPEDRRYVSLAWVAPKYFQTLGTPLLAGRDFTFQDQRGSRVAIINQTMARYYFGGNNPIGKHVTIDRDRRTGGWYGDDQPYEIVGVVGDAKYHDPGEAAQRVLYFNAFQEDRIQPHFVLRTNVDPSAVIAGVRRTVTEVSAALQVKRVTTMAAQVDASVVPERLAAMLAGAFAALGAILAAIGLYGLLAFTVVRRTREIGIRIALGATRSDVARMVLGAALQMSIAGLVLGLSVVLWARKITAHLIDDLPLESPVPIAFAGGVIIAVALIAAYLPARRAARLDPMEALRCE